MRAGGYRVDLRARPRPLMFARVMFARESAIIPCIASRADSGRLSRIASYTAKCRGSEYLRIVYGPEYLHPTEPFPPRGQAPIAEALRRLGALPVGRHDEFVAVGLGRYRSTQAWHQASLPGRRERGA